MSMGVAALLGWLILASCSPPSQQKSASRLAVPEYFPPEVLNRYAVLMDSAMDAAAAERWNEAIKALEAQVELVPNSVWPSFYLACLRNRSGDVDAGMGDLTRAVENGWDDPDRLESVSDLELLRRDARFPSLVAQARARRTTEEETFAAGLPVYRKPPYAFADSASLARWVDEQRDLMRSHEQIWSVGQALSARMDFEARRLAAASALHRGRTGFDEGIERLRALAAMHTIFDVWGPFADGVQREVERYLATNPGTEGRSEAEYHAGVAAYCRSRVRDPADPGWAEQAAGARKRFGSVAPGSHLEGSAQAWLLALDLKKTGEYAHRLLPQVREFARAYRDDPAAMEIASTFFQDRILAAIWPVPLDAADLDGRPVSVDQFHGRVLLVDFWATWCGPCVAELPAIRDLYAKYHARGLDVLSISLDYSDRMPAEKLREWTESHEMPWRQVYDGQAWKGPVAQAFMVKGIPYAVLVGPDGSLAASGNECRGERLAAIVAKLLPEK
ncbi:TlpA family protein disulfide reductase [bacterium]|nr:TlpA family protein disulfide reductase [bacterium]